MRRCCGFVCRGVPLPWWGMAVLQNVPFRRTKRHVSSCKTGCVGIQNGLFCSALAVRWLGAPAGIVGHYDAPRPLALAETPLRGIHPPREAWPPVVYAERLSQVVCAHIGYAGCASGRPGDMPQDGHKYQLEGV